MTDSEAADLKKLVLDLQAQIQLGNGAKAAEMRAHAERLAKRNALVDGLMADAKKVYGADAKHVTYVVGKGGYYGRDSRLYGHGEKVTLPADRRPNSGFSVYDPKNLLGKHKTEEVLPSPAVAKPVPSTLAGISKADVAAPKGPLAKSTRASDKDI